MKITFHYTEATEYAALVGRLRPLILKTSKHYKTPNGWRVYLWLKKA